MCTDFLNQIEKTFKIPLPNCFIEFEYLQKPITYILSKYCSGLYLLC